LHPSEQIPSLLVNNEKLKDPKIGANAFNNFFLNITEQLNIKNLNKGDGISFLKDSFPVNFPILKIIPNTAAEIDSIIHSLKPKSQSLSRL